MWLDALWSPSTWQISLTEFHILLLQVTVYSALPAGPRRLQGCYAVSPQQEGTAWGRAQPHGRTTPPWTGRAWQCTAAVVADKFPAIQKGQLFLIKFEVRRLKVPERKSAPHIAEPQCAEKGTLQCFELLICLLSQQRPGPSSVKSRLLFNAWVSFTQCTERVFVVNRLQVYQTFSSLPQ